MVLLLHFQYEYPSILRPVCIFVPERVVLNAGTIVNGLMEMKEYLDLKDVFKIADHKSKWWIRYGKD